MGTKNIVMLEKNENACVLKNERVKFIRMEIACKCVKLRLVRSSASEIKSKLRETLCSRQDFLVMRVKYSLYRTTAFLCKIQATSVTFCMRAVSTFCDCSGLRVQLRLRKFAAISRKRAFDCCNKV